MIEVLEKAIELIGQVNFTAPFLILVAGVFFRNSSAIIFGLACSIFALIVGDRIDAQDYNFYYLFAAIADYLIVRMISDEENPDIVIQKAAQRFIYINLLGWAFFMVYISSNEYYKHVFNIYVLLSFVNYAHVLIRTIGGKNGTDRANKLDHWIGDFYSNNHRRLIMLRSVKEEKKN